MTEKGTLYLIPVTLGEVNHLEVLPLTVRKAIEQIDHYIVENEKTARRFIKNIYPSKSQPKLQFDLINKFTASEEIPTFLEPCNRGLPMGLMSEAGVPGIADPGADVIAAAHAIGIKVKPLVGPSSILLAMMSSGLNGQNFAFNGYLPIERGERKKTIKDLESHSRDQKQAQIFIETPYRNNKLLDELLSTLSSTTRLCIARDLSLTTEFIKMQTVNQWKKNIPDLHKKPAIFIFQS
jgi:16S rRNA (cytidine1402-2'-O)-methyltransferase